MIHLLELEQNSTVATDTAPPAGLVECLPCSCERAQGRLPEVTQSHSISYSSIVASQWMANWFLRDSTIIQCGIYFIPVELTGAFLR